MSRYRKLEHVKRTYAMYVVLTCSIFLERLSPIIDDNFTRCHCYNSGLVVNGQVSTISAIFMLQGQRHGWKPTAAERESLFGLQCGPRLISPQGNVYFLATILLYFSLLCYTCLFCGKYVFVNCPMMWCYWYHYLLTIINQFKTLSCSLIIVWLCKNLA